MSKKPMLKLPLEDYERMVHQRNAALCRAKDIELEFDKFKAEVRQSNVSTGYTVKTYEEYERLWKDAELGELVRKLPIATGLHHDSGGWIVKSYLSDSEGRYETPEEAFRVVLGEE